MKLKLVVLLLAVLCYAGLVACNNKEAQTATAFVNNPATPAPDGVDPPHAVDTAGKAIPNESATQPDKPIILAKDSEDPKWGEMKQGVAFDHVKHSTLPAYGLDGKAIAACVDCHHTDQPSAPAGQAYLKKFERKEVLTAKQLETSKEVVKSCRACHFQKDFVGENGEESPKSVTYPADTNRPPSGVLTNEIAYHLNCITCHTTAKKRDAKIKAPESCEDCHVKKG